MNNKELKEKFQFRIALSKIEQETYTFKNTSISIKKSVIAACVCLFLTTGIVFAKDIEEFIKDKFGLGKGIQTAVDNDYIENVSMDFIYSASNISSNPEVTLNTGLKINNFLIDSTHLSFNVSFKIDEQIKEYINLDKLNTIFLSSCTITNEENFVLYSSNINDLTNNIQSTNSGVNINSISIDTINNLININYNFYTEGETFPHSKKININLKSIEFETLDENSISNSLTLIGDWKISLDVPEKMYFPISQDYKVINCENEDFNIYTAKATDTGFEFGIKISNIKKPTYPQELDEQEHEIFKNKGEIQYPQNSTTLGTKTLATATINSKDITNYYKNSPYKDLYEDYYTKQYPVR